MKTKKAPAGREHLYESPSFNDDISKTHQPNSAQDTQPIKGRSHKHKKHYPSRILMYIFIIAAIASFSIGCYVKIHASKSMSDIKKEQQIVSTYNNEQTSAEQTDLPDVLPQLSNLVEKYPSMYGWLTIADTVIDYPVMQSPDSEYYLDHDYTGEESLEGAVFADPGSTFYPPDNFLVLYGHNMKSGNIFGGLSKYESKSYLATHDTISFSTRYESNTYKIAAVIKTHVLDSSDEGFRYYQCFGYETPEEFATICNFISDGQLYDTGEDITYGDELLLLSTCEYSQDDGRLVLVAVRQ